MLIIYCIRIFSGLLFLQYFSSVVACPYRGQTCCSFTSQWCLTRSFVLGADLILFSLRESFHNNPEEEECILEEVHIQNTGFLSFPHLLWMGLFNSIFKRWVKHLGFVLGVSVSMCLPFMDQRLALGNIFCKALVPSCSQQPSCMLLQHMIQVLSSKSIPGLVQKCGLLTSVNKQDPLHPMLHQLLQSVLGKQEGAW